MPARHPPGGLGADWGEGVVRACLEAEGTSSDLDTWLADEFFEGHCRLFQPTPFIWHVWDGVGGGFSALVNYHKLCAPNGQGRRLLEKLRDTYLGEWIARQRRLVLDGDATAEDRLAAVCASMSAAVSPIACPPATACS